MNNEEGSLESKRDFISLKLLSEIEKDSSITQRALSNRLGIALGLTNIFIKRLIRKGHIKITTLPRNRIKYLLTPQGIKEKSRLTYEYMKFSLQYYREIRRKIDNLYALLLEEGVKKIVLYGDGELAELAYISLRGTDFDLIGIVDEDKIGEDFFGRRIIGFDELKKLPYDVILISSAHDGDRHLEQLKEYQFNEQCIYKIF